MFDEAIAAQNAGDYLTLMRLARDIVAKAEAGGDETARAWGYYFAGAASFQRNDGPTARRDYKMARDIFERLDNAEGRARAMLGLAAVALDIDLDSAEARRVYDLCVPIVRGLGDQRRLGIVLGNLGEICRIEGNATEALRWAAESVALFRESGDPAYAGWQLTSMGHYHLLKRDPQAALESMREAYDELRKDPIPRWVAWYFDIAFIIAASLDRWAEAAQLLGFVNRYRDESSAPRMPGILPWFSRPIERLASELDGRYEELLDRGEHLTPESAHELFAAVTVA